MKKKESKKTGDKAEKDDFPGYPQYPKNEDIYSRMKEETEIDPEDTSHKKTVETTGKLNEKDFNEDVSGSDLDVPGAELDDPQEDIGSEDEENNQYSRSKN